MMGHNIQLKGAILKIIPKLSILPLLIWSSVYYLAFQVEEIQNKGRGVVATKFFKRGDFVVEYAGDLIDIKQAKEREENYSKQKDVGCYMYYFNFKNKQYW